MLAGRRLQAYRTGFNEHRPKVHIRPQPAPPVGDRRAFARGDFGPARSRRGVRRAQSPDREEAELVARAHADQSVLRSLDPHPGLVRARRQTARRRRHEHVGRFVLHAQGRNADRHRDHSQRHAPGHHRGPPPRLGRGRAAGAQGRLLRDQCRRRLARASDPGAARRAHHPPQQGPHRAADRGHLRRHSAFAGRALEHHPAQCARRAGARGRAFDAAAGRHRAVRRRGDARHARGPARRRYRDDAAPAARAHERLVRALDAGVLPLFRARPEEARLRQAGRAGHASGPDEPRGRDRHRRCRRRPVADPRAGRDGRRGAHGRARGNVADACRMPEVRARRKGDRP